MIGMEQVIKDPGPADIAEETEAKNSSEPLIIRMRSHLPT